MIIDPSKSKESHYRAKGTHSPFLQMKFRPHYGLILQLSFAVLDLNTAISAIWTSTSLMLARLFRLVLKSTTSQVNIYSGFTGCEHNLYVMLVDSLSS
jgi:hypothetical protein